MTCKKGGGDALNIVTFEVDLWREGHGDKLADAACYVESAGFMMMN